MSGLLALEDIVSGKCRGGGFLKLIASGGVSVASSKSCCLRAAKCCERSSKALPEGLELLACCARRQPCPALPPFRRLSLPPRRLPLRGRGPSPRGHRHPHHSSRAPQRFPRIRTESFWRPQPRRQLGHSRRRAFPHSGASLLSEAGLKQRTEAVARFHVNLDRQPCSRTHAFEREY